MAIFKWVKRVFDRIHQVNKNSPEQKPPVTVASADLPKSLIGSPTFTEETNIEENISSEGEILSLALINGVPIAEIEKRARPSGDGEQGYQTEGWSCSGFLGRNESFKEVLLLDWMTVRALSWTHEALARHLGSIALLAKKETLRKEGITLNYDYSLSGKYQQKLRAVYVEHRGFQEDIFDKSNHWSSQCLIMNLSNGSSVMWTPGVEGYIRKYGFYEGGGKENPYRVDPLILISLLTGERVEQLRDKVIACIGCSG